MKRILKLILEFSLVVGAMAFFLHLPALAQEGTLPFAEDGAAKTIYESVGPTPPSGDANTIMSALIYGGLSYVKVIIGVVGILMITIMGFQLLIAMGNDEEISKAKNGLIYSIIAFVMVSMAEDIGKIVDMGGGKTLLESPQEILKRVTLFDRQVEIVMTFIKYTIGAFATIMVIKSSIKLITSGGNDEEVSTNKKSIMYSAGGLALIFVGDIFIKKVFYKVDKTAYTGVTGIHPGVDAQEGVTQIAGIVNMIVTFGGPVAVLMLIAAAIMYATAGGDDEAMRKAKRLIVAAIVGLVVMYGAFAIVGTIISSRLSEIGGAVNSVS